MRSLEQERDYVRTVSGLVNGNGGIGTGTGYSVQKTGTGAYLLRFNPAFRAYLSAVVTLTVGGFVVVTWGSPSQDNIQIYTYSTSTAAADIGFLFIVRGIAR